MTAEVKHILFKRFAHTCKVIFEGDLYDFVGIGLIPLNQKATVEDHSRYPVITDDIQE